MRIVLLGINITDNICKESVVVSKVIQSLLSGYIVEDDAFPRMSNAFPDDTSSILLENTIAAACITPVTYGTNNRVISKNKMLSQYDRLDNTQSLLRQTKVNATSTTSMYCQPKSGNTNRSLHNTASTHRIYRIASHISYRRSRVKASTIIPESNHKASLVIPELNRLSLNPTSVTNRNTTTLTIAGAVLTSSTEHKYQPPMQINILT